MRWSSRPCAGRRRRTTVLYHRGGIGGWRFADRRAHDDGRLRLRSGDGVADGAPHRLRKAYRRGLRDRGGFRSAFPAGVAQVVDAFALCPRVEHQHATSVDRNEAAWIDRGRPIDTPPQVAAHLFRRLMDEWPRASRVRCRSNRWYRSCDRTHGGKPSCSLFCLSHDIMRLLLRRLPPRSGSC